MRWWSTFVHRSTTRWRRSAISYCPRRVRHEPSMSEDEKGGPRYRPATRVAHLGRDPASFLGAINTPVFRASTMLFPTMADLEAAARGQYAGISYALHGLP